MKLKVGDYIIAVIIVMSAAVIFALTVCNKQTAANAEVWVDGQLVRSIQLKQKQDEYLTIHHHAVTFQVHLKNGKIAISDIDCPDKICEKTGFIGKSGQSIVCLPNKVMIKTVGNDVSGEVDLVAQ